MCDGAIQVCPVLCCVLCVVVVVIFVVSFVSFSLCRIVRILDVVWCCLAANNVHIAIDHGGSFVVVFCLYMYNHSMFQKKSNNKKVYPTYNNKTMIASSIDDRIR